MHRPLEGRIGAERGALSEAARTIRDELAEHGVEAAAIHAVDVALEELVTNALRHGGPVARETGVRWKLELAPQHLRLVLEDDGVPFDPSAAPSPAPLSSLADATVGGRGIAMVRALVRELRHERTRDGNRVIVVIPRT